MSISLENAPAPYMAFLTAIRYENAGQKKTRIDFIDSL